MTTQLFILIIWSALCLGLALAMVSSNGRTTGEVSGEIASNLGVGIVLWSVGIGVWMVVSFLVRYFE